MLQRFWTYTTERNWDYHLYPEILRSNIFCYGAKNTGKTTRIAHPILRNAIAEGRSCVIYAENVAKEYANIQSEAVSAGYRIYEVSTNVKDDFKQIRIARAIVAEIKNETQPLLVMVSNPNFQEPNQKNFVDQLINRLSAMGKNDIKKQQISRDQQNATLFVLDGLCGNMILPNEILQPQWLQYCIIMDERIAYTPWRNNAIFSAINSEYYAADIQQVLRQYSNIQLMRRFFLPIETVICTGVPNIKTEMNRDFISNCCFIGAKQRIGGRFIIMEKTIKNKPDNVMVKNPYLGKDIKIDEETITESAYSEIAKQWFRPGKWLVECNGSMALFYANGAYQPIILGSRAEAVFWLEVKSKDEGYALIRKDEVEGIIRHEYLLDGQTVEFCLIHIGKGEEENYQLQYYMEILNVAERDDIIRWLQTEEAVSQGYDPEDGVETNLQKYYSRIEEEQEAQQRSAGETGPSSMPEIQPADRYWEKYQVEDKVPIEAPPAPIAELPDDGVLFLGGHWNMVKKIQQLHPNWIFITDDAFKPFSNIHVKYVFYWTNHSSHTMMENVFSKLAPGADIMYVTATNMERLEKEMLERFEYNRTRKRRGENSEV